MLKRVSFNKYQILKLIHDIKVITGMYREQKVAIRTKKRGKKGKKARCVQKKSIKALCYIEIFIIYLQ